MNITCSSISFFVATATNFLCARYTDFSLFSFLKILFLNWHNWLLITSLHWFYLIILALSLMFYDKISMLQIHPDFFFLFCHKDPLKSPVQWQFGGRYSENHVICQFLSAWKITEYIFTNQDDFNVMRQ